MILVSACLLGIDCKYNGLNNKNENVLKYLEGKNYVIACPEQLGGLTTPRNPSEIVKIGEYEINDYKLLSNEGKDVSESFIKGAKETHHETETIYRRTEVRLRAAASHFENGRVGHQHQEDLSHLQRGKPAGPAETSEAPGSTVSRAHASSRRMEPAVVDGLRVGSTLDRTEVLNFELRR